ncbi:MAG: ABC transporter permease [Ardenticatenales bacterium]|nr:ABC transporter permease [Ardenticatenales bacterium]
MNQRRIKTIIGKEWAETIRNKTITGTFAMLLVVFTLMPLGFAFGMPLLIGDEITKDPDVEMLNELLVEMFPQFAALSIIEQFQVFMLRQFLPMFLLVPIMGAMSIATYSIIGEKTSRSLEALLATPIRTDELLLAKSIAAALPSVGATWGAFLVFALASRLLGGAEVARYAIDSAAWSMILLITPLVAFLGLGLGVIVSSRVNDARSAQQLGGVLVLPIVGLMVGQTAGLFLLGVPLVIIGAVVLFLIDLAVMAIGVSLFNREAILTRWK